MPSLCPQMHSFLRQVSHKLEKNVYSAVGVYSVLYMLIRSFVKHIQMVYMLTVCLFDLSLREDVKISHYDCGFVRVLVLLNTYFEAL